MKNYLIALVVVIFSMASYLFWKVNEQKAEISRLGENQNSLLIENERYKTADSLNVLKIGRLQLTTKEFEKYNSDLTETVKKLNIKIKRLESVTETGTQSTTQFVTQIKDSLIFLPGKIDTLKCIDFKTEWDVVSGCIMDNNTFNGVVKHQTKLIQVVHRVPRKFLFIKYGTKGINQEVLTKNPDEIIEYSRYIELQR